MTRTWLFLKQYRLAFGGKKIKGRSEAEIKSTRGIMMKDEVREVSKMQLIGGVEVMLRNRDFILSLLGN